MAGDDSTPSARQSELLELAYQYALQHGLTDLSLRPLAMAIGSSPRVLLFLFGSKDGVIRALLGRARADELQLLERLNDAQEDDGAPGGLAAVTEQVWAWLAADHHRALLTLWVEGYARSLTDPRRTLDRVRPQHRRGLAECAGHRPSRRRARHNLRTGPADPRPGNPARRAAGGLLATGDIKRTTAAVHQQLKSQPPSSR